MYKIKHDTAISMYDDEISLSVDEIGNLFQDISPEEELEINDLSLTASPEGWTNCVWTC